MMTVLVFTACLIGEPGNCRDVRLDYGEEPGSLMACQMGGALRAHAFVEWQIMNPARKPHAIRCLPRHKIETPV